MPASYKMPLFPLALAALVLVFLLLGSKHPVLAVATVSSWGVFLTLDIRSTWRIYQSNSDEFFNIELNRVFVSLAKGFGFKMAVFLFVLLSEIPVFLFISLIATSMLSGVLPFEPPLLARVSSASGGLAFAHWDGWRKNRQYVETKTDFTHRER